MSRAARRWIFWLVVAVSVALVIGGPSFMLMAVGTHRFLSATAGKSLPDADLVRILDESMLVPVAVTSAGMLIGVTAALCVPVLLVGAIVQFRSDRHDKA